MAPDDTATGAVSVAEAPLEPANPTEFIPDDEPKADPSPSTETVPAAETPATNEEEIGRKWAERNGYRQTPGPESPSPSPQVAGVLRNPYDIAREEAKAYLDRGQYVDSEWVSQRALEIQGYQMHSRLAAMEARMVAPTLASEIRNAGFDGAAEHIDVALDVARSLVSDPAQQRELAKLLAVGYQSLTAPKASPAKPAPPMPRAEAGTPASPGVTISATQRQVADSLARTFHGSAKASNAQIKQWLKEGFLDA